nr:ATP-binding cassette domain-containing protein [Demequina litorisediminis]
MTSPLRLEGISKRFGAVTAIQRFDLEVGPGEIVALVGDNGAGKSTLVKIISGVYQPTEGEIWLSGERAEFSDPSDARDKGVEVVYQDLALVDLQPVYMNLFLGRELTRGPLKVLDRARMARETQSLVDDLDIRIPSAKAQALGPVRRSASGNRDRQGNALGERLGADGRAHRSPRSRRDRQGRRDHSAPQGARRRRAHREPQHGAGLPDRRPCDRAEARHAGGDQGRRGHHSQRGSSR